jgi:DMSO/TMAO reductase YedYZ heme-binding membrane subunit
LSNNQRNWVVFLGAVAITVVVSGLYLGVAGSNDAAIGVALRSSAHASFIVLLVVFVARPLRQMLRTPFTAALLRNRRLLGVAFAGIHFAHLGLILYRDRQVADYSFSVIENALGGLMYLFIFLMFVTSFDTTARALGARNWRILHKTGLYAVLVAFLQTIVPDSREQVFSINGALTLLAALAIVIRLTAFLALRQRA